MPLLASRGLHLGLKGRLRSACACSIMLYECQTWPVKGEDVIRLESNDARIVRWIYNVKPEYRISAEELRSRPKLRSMRECLQDKRLPWFVHLETQSAFTCSKLTTETLE